MIGQTKAKAASSAQFGEDITSRLEEARGQIEARFLDGGAVLLSVLDGIEKLIGALDAVTSSLDPDSASATNAALTGTIEELVALPAREAGRLQDLVAIGEIERKLRSEVADMRETLRYLRIFGITAKISGAAIPDFAGFAAEIIERIQFGSEQAELFSASLGKLGGRIGPAAIRAKEIAESYGALIPAIVKNLGNNAEQLSSHRRHLASTAAKVRQLAGGVQMKLATILSAMQVGDITRQRVEHCQFALAALAEYLATPAGQMLDPDQKERLRVAIALLVACQLEQISDDFVRDTQKIVSNLSSFKSDIRQIVDLGSAMMPAENDADGDIIHRLETEIAAARQVVGKIAAGAAEADELCYNTEALVDELTKSIGVVKVVRTDIQYMALNTNLRCSRIGEEGRAINVVTAELRSFAGKMDDTAENIVVALQKLQATAKGMRGCDCHSEEPSGIAGLDGRLENAARAIHQAAEAMDQNLVVLGEQGRVASDLMTSAVAKLDFQASLGDIIAECSARAAADVVGDLDLTGLGDAVAEIGGRIFKTYTMVAERELHTQILGGPSEAPQAQQTQAAQSDEDLFDDALF